MRKTSEIKMFPETHQITPQSTISVQTYNEAASLLEQTLNITVPGPQDIDMEFMSEKLFDVLQFDIINQSHTIENNLKKQQKEAAHILVKQVKLNQTYPEHRDTDQSTQEPKKEDEEIITTISNKTPTIRIKAEKEIIKKPIVKITPPIQQSVKEEIEAPSHPDLEIFEKNLKTLQGLQNTEDKKIEALGTLQNLIQQHLGTEAVNIFKEQYINTTTGNFRLQKISVDYNMKGREKTPLQEILSELKNKLS